MYAVFFLIFCLFILFTYFQIQEDSQLYRQRKKLDDEMQRSEDIRVQKTQKRALLHHHLTRVGVNPEKDYPEALTDMTVSLYIAKQRLKKEGCESTFDMRWLPVIRGYINPKEVGNPTTQTLEKLQRALLEYKEDSFSYKSIKWALEGYPYIE
jgi:hypothetical protein